MVYTFTRKRIKWISLGVALLVLLAGLDLLRLWPADQTVKPLPGASQPALTDNGAAAAQPTTDDTAKQQQAVSDSSPYSPHAYRGAAGQPSGATVNNGGFDPFHTYYNPYAPNH